MQVLTRRGRGGVFTIRYTDADDGDFAVDGIDVESARTAVVSTPWTWLRQVHGSEVFVVTSAGEHRGEVGDASVSDIDDVALAVQGADCAPVAFWSDEGPFGIAHAGWKGIEAGVLGATASAMRGLGASAIYATVGPCIHPANYEFGSDDLDRLATKFGPTVRARTSAGTEALDVRAMISIALSDAGVAIDHDVDVCTGSSSKHYSHRVDGDTARHCGVITREWEA